MIISHKYKFIFLKTNKTAGTSIEIALSKFCGERDIITPITDEDEDIRRILGYRGPQNYLLAGNKEFYNHITAKEVKDLVVEEVWNTYYKFCFERNPWDRVISLYYFLHPSEPRPSMSEFLDSESHARLRQRGYNLYTINDKIAVNRICRYEKLEQDLDWVRRKIGLPEKISLPRAKGGHRKDRRHYREVLTPEEQIRIRIFFDKEIRLLGYSFLFDWVHIKFKLHHLLDRLSNSFDRKQ